MNILITGIHGFEGSNLIQSLSNINEDITRYSGDTGSPCNVYRVTYNYFRRPFFLLYAIIQIGTVITYGDTGL